MKFVYDEQINQWWCVDVLVIGEYGYYIEKFLVDYGVVFDIMDKDCGIFRLNICDIVLFLYYLLLICSVDEKCE